jgi:hypothetical protein
LSIFLYQYQSIHSAKERLEAVGFGRMAKTRNAAKAVDDVLSVGR